LKKFLLVSLTILSVLNTLAAPVKFVANVKEGEVHFNAIGNPDFLKVEGKGEGPSGEVSIDGKKLSARMSFALSTLDTGIKKRNEHMKEKYLKVGTHPEALLVIENVDLSHDYSASKKFPELIKYKGKLTLNGVSKDIESEIKSASKPGVHELSSDFAIKLTDFGIEIPSFAGVTIADEVKIQVKTRLKAN
jgi:polyisoprenoid-binding protein YceI